MVLSRFKKTTHLIFQFCLHYKKLDTKTHKLVDLYSLCNVKWLEPFKEKIRIIDEFYIPTRYPDGIPGGFPHRLANEADAKEAVFIAEEILQLIMSKVK